MLKTITRFSALLLLVLVLGGPGASARPGACTAAEKARRDAAVQAFKSSLTSRRRAYFRTHRSARARRAYLAEQRAELKRLERAASACQPPPGPPRPLPFFPQAGVLWQDLYVANYVDLDPGPGTLDWSCGHQTYDGHPGIDSALRSFREQRIGVPVFAALDGTVVEVQQYFPDLNTSATATPYDNHVVVAHGNAQETVYGHLRRGSVPVRVGDRVVAGQQIGLTGSSGNSSGPHLHLSVLYKGVYYEPFAGPCQPGPSGWVDQPIPRTEPYANDFAFSRSPFTGRADLPWDEATRTGTFVAGVHDVYLRAELSNVDAGSPVRVRFERPDGTIALDDSPAVDLGFWHAHGAVKLHYAPDFDVLGQWRFLLDVGGRTLVDAPFRVVAESTAIVNRPPNPVAVSLVPTSVGVVFCRVATSLVGEDPDYDIVRYRYRWLVGGKVVRTVTSAALSDAIPKRAATAGAVTCEVTPSDGTLSGPTASTG